MLFLSCSGDKVNANLSFDKVIFFSHLMHSESAPFEDDYNYFIRHHYSGIEEWKKDFPGWRANYHWPVNTLAAISGDSIIIFKPREGKEFKQKISGQLIVQLNKLFSQYLRADSLSPSYENVTYCGPVNELYITKGNKSKWFLEGLSLDYLNNFFDSLCVNAAGSSLDTLRFVTVKGEIINNAWNSENKDVILNKLVVPPIINPPVKFTP